MTIKAATPYLIFNGQAEQAIAFLRSGRFRQPAGGGSVFTPIMDAPWGALFGVVTDKYSVSWMLNHTKTK